MLRLTYLLALAGCWTAGDLAPAAPAATPITPPVVDLVAIHETTLTFVRTSPRGLADTRAVSLPHEVEQLRFLGKDPVVLMPFDDHKSVEVWQITPTGHTAIAIPDLATWPAVDTTNFDHFDWPQWELVTTTDHAIWLGRCEWGYMGEGSSCTEWAYMRLAPGPPIGTRAQPEKQVSSSYHLSAHAPLPSAIAVAIVGDPTKPDDEAYKDRHVVECTRAGHATREYPVSSEREPGNGFMDVDKLRWLQTDPPMWSIERSDGCMDVCTRTVIFEGCSVSKRFESARLVDGPDNVFALATNDRASIRWQGRQLGALDANIVDFVPR